MSYQAAKESYAAEIAEIKADSPPLTELVTPEEHQKILEKSVS